VGITAVTRKSKVFRRERMQFEFDVDASTMYRQQVCDECKADGIANRMKGLEMDLCTSGDKDTRQSTRQWAD
jgi:hypothetical protein